MRTILFSLLLPAVALADAVTAPPASAPASAPDVPILYERDIAPVLRTYCSGCHNEVDLEGGFSVETFATLMKGGDDHADPIHAGDPAKSFLIQSIEGTAKPKMPPKDEPPVPAPDLALLKRWISEGAKGPANDLSILRQLVVPQLPPSRAQRAITAAELSRDGTTLAVARHDVVDLLDAGTGALKRSLDKIPGPVNAVHFSKDGSQLVLASGITGLTGVAQLRDTATGAAVREFGEARDALFDAEFSPDGTLLATAGYDRIIRIWNVADGKLVRAIDVHKGAIFDLAFEPTGKVLASASADETVKLWRIADGVRLDTLNQPQGEQVAVQFTRDGKFIVATGADKRIHMWRFTSREKPDFNPIVHSRFAHEAAIVGLATSADGKWLLSSAADRTLKVWSLPALELQEALAIQRDIAPVLLPVAATGNEAKFYVGRMDGSSEIVAFHKPQAAPSASAKESVQAGAAPAAPTTVTMPAAETTAAKIDKREEIEPNNTPSEATPVGAWPVKLAGNIASERDADLFRFSAKAGQEVVLEIDAAMSKSKMDSRIEVLTADGKPVEQVVLQATRDSWLTFRGKNSDVTDDFRLHNWAEMELNEYLYANGEVVRLWLYPRGPDSGFKVYPGDGKRFTAFGTSPLAHPMGEPAYIVHPLPPGSQPAPNGLPVFRLNYENDDDPYRRRGSDSVLQFKAPADGDYLARVTDVRDFGGAKDYHYTLTIRPRKLDFKVTVGGMNPKVSPGSAREITFKVDRMDGYEGPIRIAVENLPAGFKSPQTVEIEQGQISAESILFAAADAQAPGPEADKAVKITASAEIDGIAVSHNVGTLGDIDLAKAPKVLVEILPGPDRSYVRETPGEPLEFTIRPGQTISAKVRATRADFTGRIELGKEDAGRNLPHGLYVDNIGLNGLLIVEGQTEREFFITASPIAQPSTRMFHLKAGADGGQASLPAILRVVSPVAQSSAAR